MVGAFAGFAGNVASQTLVEGKGICHVDYGSAGLSALAGLLGGGLGGGLAGAKTPAALAAIPAAAARGPLFSEFGQAVVAAGAGGAAAGALDVAFH